MFVLLVWWSTSTVNCKIITSRRSVILVTFFFFFFFLDFLYILADILDAFFDIESLCSWTSLLETSYHIMKTCPCNIYRFFKLLKLKIENFHWQMFDIFLIFAQNIDCGYTLKPPRRGGSNENPLSMFLSKNKKNRYTPAHHSFTI